MCLIYGNKIKKQNTRNWKIILKDIRFIMLNIIIFGTGKVFEKKIDTILTCNNLKIVGYIDNNPLKIGKRIQGKSVYNPEMIKDLSYDYVLITSENYLREMEEQLLAFGVPSGKILFWEKLMVS